MNSLIGTVLNSVWQAAAIAAFAWTILRFSPKMNAATRHVVWWAVLASVIALPAVRPLMQPERPAPPVNIRPAATPSPVFVGPIAPAPVMPRSSAPIELEDDAWRVLLPALWLTGFCFQLLRIVLSYWHVRRLKHRAVPAGSEA